MALRESKERRGDVIIDLHQRALELEHVLLQDNEDDHTTTAMMLVVARRLLFDFLQASSRAMKAHHLGDPSPEGYVGPVQREGEQ